MKTFLSILLLAGCFTGYLSSTAFAAQAAQRLDCNQQAEGKLGTERARIISACVKHNASINTVPPMLSKITECNHKAGSMEGQERLKFVDKCMENN